MKTYDIIQKPRGKNNGFIESRDTCPTITRNAFEQNVLIGEMEPTIIEDFYANRDAREFEGIAPTLRSERFGLKVKEPIMTEIKEPMAYDCYNQCFCPEGMINTVRPQFSRPDPKANGTKIVEPSAKGKQKNGYRIRRLTPKECFRLMGFSDQDFLAAKVGNRKAAAELLARFPKHEGKRLMSEVERLSKMSNSQLYKQAGNSIGVPVLEAIFKEML